MPLPGVKELCGAKCRDGSPCKNPAMVRKGRARCKKHGKGGRPRTTGVNVGRGKVTTINKATGLERKTKSGGMYSTVTHESLEKKIKRAAGYDQGLDNEVELMRGVMQELLEIMQKRTEPVGGTISRNDIRDALRDQEGNTIYLRVHVSDSVYNEKTLFKLQSTADSIRKLIETAAKIQSEQKFMLSMPDIRMIMNQMQMVAKDVLAEFIKDEDDYQAAITQFSRRLANVKVLDGEA